jgi:hypothetical protein
MATTIINKKRIRRRFWTSAFLLAVFTLVGWLRFQQALRYWYYLIEIKLWPHPLYFAASGGLIGLGYGLALLFHLLRFRYISLYIRVLTALFLIWLWIDRIWIVTRESFLPLLPITILITVCTIGLNLLYIRRTTQHRT